MRWDQSQPSSTLQRGHTHRYETPCGWASAPASCRSWEVGKGGHQLKWNSAHPYTRHPPSPPCPVFASSQSGPPLAGSFASAPLLQRQVAGLSLLCHFPAAHQPAGPSDQAHLGRGSQYTRVLQSQVLLMPYEAPRHHPPTVSEHSKGPVAARSSP